MTCHSVAPVRILIVEDDADHARLLSAQLREVGYQVIGIAGDGDEALSKAQSGQPDLVIMDIVLPGGQDGIETAAILAQRWDIPVLYLTAYSDEELYARARATSPFAYLHKPYDGHELRRAVELALDRHALLRRLKESEAHLAEAQALAGMGSWVWHIGEDRVELSGQLMRMLALEPGEFEPRFDTFLHLACAADRPAILGAVETLLRGEPAGEIDVHLCSTAAPERVFRLLGHPRLDASGRVMALVGTARDITAEWHAEREAETYRQQLEEQVAQRTSELSAANARLQGEIVERIQLDAALSASEQRYRSLVENLPEPLLVMQDDRIVFANPALAHLLGLPASGAAHGMAVFDLVHADSHAACAACKQACLAGQPPGAPTQIKVLRADGSFVEVEVVTFPFDYEGRPAVLAVLRDLTERVAMEQVAERFRAALDSSSDGYFLIDPQAMRFIDVNASACANLDYSREQLLQLGPQDIKPLMNRGMLRQQFAAVLAGRPGAETLTTQHQRQDGTTFPVEVRLRPFASGGQHLIVAVARDISAQLRNEATLRETDARFRQLAESIDEAFWIRDLRENRFVYANPAYERLYGKRVDSLYRHARSFLSSIHPEDRDRVAAAYDQQLLQASGLDLEYRVVVENQTRWLWVRTFPIRDADGEVYRSIGLAKDMTERRQAEERYQTIIQAAMDGFWITDDKGCLLEANEAACRMTGYSREELRALSLGDLEAIETPEVTHAHIQRIIEQGQDRFETRHRCKDGREIDIEASVYYLSGYNGGRFYAFFRDITESKAANLALRESEARFATVFRSAPIGIAITREADDRIVDFNDSLLEIVGYASQELVGKTTLELGIWAEAEKRGQVLERLRATGSLHNMELGFRRKSGDIGDGLVSMESIELNGERHLLSLLVDISERTRAERTLAESEQRYRSLVSSLPGIAYRCALDADWTVEIMSGEVERLTGYPASDFLQGSRTYASIIHPDDRDRVWREVERGVSQHEDFELEYRLLDCDGHTRIVHERGHGVFDDVGALQWLDGFIWDVTERRQAEQALVVSEERYRAVVEDQTELICRLRADGTLTFVNPVFCRFFGKREEELIDTTWRLCAHPDDVAMIEARLATLSPSNPVAVIENRVTSGQGDVRWMQFVNRASFDATGSLTQIQAVARDITDRKNAELAQQAAEQFKQAVLDAVSTQVAVLDAQGTIVDVNAAWRRFADENARVAGQAAEHSDIGANYLRICEAATGISCEGAREVAQGIREVLAGKRVFFQHEYPCHAPWQQRWFLLSVTPLQGGARGVVISHSDISAPKKLAEELRQSEARTRSILRAAPVGIGVLVDRMFQEVNEGMTRMSGYAAEELIGRSERMIYPGQADFDRVGEEIYRQIREQGIGSVETRWRRRDGRIIDVALSSAPIVPGDLRQGMTFTAKDITGEKHAEQERLLHEAAQRDALVREVHHRIKNNLQGVIGLLRQHMVQHPDTQVALEAAMAQINTIAVVHGLQGRMPQSELRLRELLREVIDATASLALLSQPPRLEESLGSDVWLEGGAVVSVALILNELIHNAIKHGGDVDSMVIRLESDSGQATLRIVNRGGPLLAGFNLATGQGCGTGLDLVRTLLPRRGASLNLRQHGEWIETELVFTPPMIQPPAPVSEPASPP